MRFLDRPECREFLATVLNEVMSIFMDQGAIPSDHAKLVNESIELASQLCFRMIDEYQDVRCINAMVTLMKPYAARYTHDKLVSTLGCPLPTKAW